MIEFEESEQIIEVVHRHWFILLGHIATLFFLVLFPVIALVTLHYVPIEKFFTFSGSTSYAGGFFLFLWFIIVWMIAWKMWTTYYLDVLVITDKRIFNIDQLGLFHRESGSFRIDRIQNMTVDQKGIIQTLLDFGTLRIETAGENIGFVAEYIAQPYRIKKMINEMQDGKLDRTQEVHLHPETLSRLSPTRGGARETERDTEESYNHLKDQDGV